jgi:cystathionine gamma-lyase
VNDGARFETKVIHAGQSPDPRTGAVMPPVYQTSTYVQDGPGNHKGYEYARTQNPTREAFEACIAALELGDTAIATSSGCAATTMVLHLLRAGDHVVSGDDVYGGTYRLFTKVFAGLGIEFSFVDLTNPRNLDEAIRPTTRLVWLESPTNPLLKVVDVAAVAERARARGVRVVVDNTFLSPALQNPLELGADLVVHSTTKYLGGHSDVVGGVIVARKGEDADRLRFLQNAVGAVPGPWDCFLVLRGLKTLALRMERHTQNAGVIASWLATHPKVERVMYPGLATHPGHSIQSRQARGAGGMVSFEIRGGLEAARRVLTRTRLFACAESLGGVESLIEHPAIMTHASVPAEVRRQLGIGDGFIRLSVGVEHVDDLRADLEAAFAAL